VQEAREADLMRALLHRFSHWLWKKTMPAVLAGGQWSGSSYIDAFKRSREPTPNELLQELKGTAWACISINAAVCASYPPRLYVTTAQGQPAAKCRTKSLAPRLEQKLRASPRLAVRHKAAWRLEEVTEHAILGLLEQPSPLGVSLSPFDLWELTQVYLEVHGRAFWFLDRDALGTPRAIWPLPAQNVTPKRNPDSPQPVDYYQYRTGAREQRFAPEDIVFFRFPDPRDPYTGGLSPLRAAFEQVSLTSEYAATKASIYDNRAIPSALVSPDAVIGEEERDRLESQINQKFRRRGAGRIMVAESSMKVQLLNQSLGDLAALADMKATKEDIANAFHVPIAYFTTNTNLANLMASQVMHMQLAIGPRLQRRDEKLNEQLVPLFDPSGRLFLASEDPIPVDMQLSITQQANDLKYGVISINEQRSERGLPPVPWGNVPWLPAHWLPTDAPNRGTTGQIDPGPSDTEADQTTGVVPQDVDE
jgi:HK97 family phage portal protein